jgi:hypothetical protein
MSDRFPVWVSVTRDDGRVEQVRVGSAVKTGEGFTIAFDSMIMGSSPMTSAPRAAAPARQASMGGGGGDGMIFPPYGRSKGMPVSGASMQDLEFYANGSRRSLADPSKSRWHDKERQLLGAIEAEIARQRGEEPSPPSPSDEPPPPGDEDAPF